jgi:glycosyltransferase involved in cell wall biosynthesis
MKLFVSMNYKTPIVVSRTPAIEQVVNDDDVFFHEPDSADSLSDTIDKVLSNNDEASRRAENAYKKVQEFSWENRAKSAVDFISKTK